MNEWIPTLFRLVSEGQPAVLITVAHTAGSAPRRAGTKMLVTVDRLFGTIGGGNLEYNAIQSARSLFTNTESTTRQIHLDLYALGPMLEQCCGGVVFLHYELISGDNAAWVKTVNELTSHSRKVVIVTHTGSEEAAHKKGDKLLVTEFATRGSLGDLDKDAIERARRLLHASDESPDTLLHPLSPSKGSLPDINDVLVFDIIRPVDFHVALYGGGHVGSAIVSILEKSLSCKITWVDSREDIFPAIESASVTLSHAAMPTSTVEEMPGNSYYLVMTHSHAMDLALCEAILQRDDIQFLGLIGSETKAKRFRKQLLDKGFTDDDLLRLTCPIGIDGIDSKEPGAIAVSVVTQLLQLYEARDANQKVSNKNDNVYSI